MGSFFAASYLWKMLASFGENYSEILFLSKGEKNLEGFFSHRGPSFGAGWGDPPTYPHLNVMTREPTNTRGSREQNPDTSILHSFLGLDAGLLVKSCLNIGGG